MSTSANKGYTYLEDGVLSVPDAANLVIRQTDALDSVTAVISMDLPFPPMINSDGDLYIAGATDVVSGWIEGYLMEYVAEGDFWRPYNPPAVGLWMVLNRADGLLYKFDLDASPGPQWTARGIAQIAAEDVTYDNATSGLSSTNVQDAVDELAAFKAAFTSILVFVVDDMEEDFGNLAVRGQLNWTGITNV